MKVYGSTFGTLLLFTDSRVVLVNQTSGTPLSAVTLSIPLAVREVYQPVAGEVYVLTNTKLHRFTITGETMIQSWEVSIPSLGPITFAGYSGYSTVMKGLNGSGFVTNWSVNKDTGANIEIEEIAYIGFGNILKGNMLLDVVNSGVRIRNHVLGTSVSIDVTNPSLSNSIVKNYNNKWYLMIAFESEFGSQDYMLVIMNNDGNVIENIYTTNVGNSLSQDQILDFMVNDDGKIFICTNTPQVIRITPGEDPVLIILDVPGGFTSRGGYFSLPDKLFLYGSVSSGDLLIHSSLDLSPGPSSVSDLTTINVSNFSPSTYTYSLAIPNSSSTFGVQYTYSDNQRVLVYFNDLISQTPSSIPLPVGTSEIRVVSVSENSLNVSEYVISVTRALPVDGVVYVDSSSGSVLGSGSSSQPIKSYKQGMGYSNSTLSLKIRDFLPNYPGTNFSFMATPVSSQTAPLIITSGVNVIKLMNPNPSYTYLFAAVGSVRDNSIASFLLKVLNPASGEFVTNGPFQLEVYTPYHSSRTHLRLMREDNNSEISGGLVSSAISTYGVTLSSNSVYTIVDSGSLVVDPGIGSDPHIKTIFGRKYDLPKQYRYSKTGVSLLKTSTGEIRGRVTGLPNGEFLSKADITILNNRVMEIDFEKRRSKILVTDSVRNISVESNLLKNITKKSNKVTEMFFLETLWEGGVYILVNYQHRYICPIFNKHPVETDNISGVLV